MIQIRKVSETPQTITLGWDPVPGCDGYRFYSKGLLRSKTMDPLRKTVQFAKGQEPYKVEAVVLTPIDSGTYPSAPPVYTRVAPRVVYAQDGSDARFCLTNPDGSLRPGVRQLPSGKYTDESGAIYTDLDGLDESGRRSGAPAPTGAREIDGRPICSLPTEGDPTKNTGSWSI